VPDMTVAAEMTSAAFLDDVMRQSEMAVRAGSALPIDSVALSALMKKLQPEVGKQLHHDDLADNQKQWFADSKNVILASTMLGAIATCVARLNHEDTVTEESLTKAFTLVKTECGGKFGPEGCYCGC
jgi:hypothetical protein